MSSRRTLITLTCPDDCSYRESYHIPTQRLQELQEDLAENEVIEDAVLGLLLQDWQECPHCSTRYEVELGSTVGDDEDGGMVVAGP